MEGCDKDEFYVMDITATGDLHLWWRPGWRGYTTDLACAGVYSREEAERIQKIRGTDIPHRKSTIDAVARRVVLTGDLPRTR